MAQPKLLADRAPEYEDQLCSWLAGKSFEMVVLAARGSSDNAATYAKYLIEIHTGIPVILSAPSVLTRFGRRVRYPKSLIVGISQSGAAPDVFEVLAAGREEGHATLAITNHPDSRLAQVADFALALNVGEEVSVAATKTYTASLVAIAALARALGGDLPPCGAAAFPTDDWLELARRAAVDARGPVLRFHPLFALARGYDFSTANETALKLMECALVPCKSFSTADFEHGPIAMAGPGSAAIVFGEPSQQLQATGCKVISPPPGPDSPFSPIWNIFFGQWLALECARALGLDPDNPRNLNKVTRTL